MPTLTRLTFWCLVTACSTSTTEPPVDEDPACAGEAGEAARIGDELPWDLDPALDSNRFACPEDNPDCDRLDAPDAIDEIGQELSAIDPTHALYGLADPLNSAGRYRVWPNGRIPYRLARDSAGNPYINSTTRERLSQAMTNWEKLTEGRIKFRPKLASDTAYVVITQGSPRVSPFVGYRKDQVQTMYLRDSEYITVIKHELGHVVGLHHEQRRTDRSSYIKVLTSNIVDDPGCKYQFSTCSTCTKVGTYDRSSVMHYRTTDLGNCRTGPVLLKLDGSAISHYWQLSGKDLTSVAKMYAVPSTPPPTPPTTPALPESGSITSSDLCATVADASTLDGAAIHTSTCTGEGHQDWRITPTGQLRVQHSLGCTAVVGCSTPGAVVEQATCAAEAPDQKWLLSKMELVHGVSGKCVDGLALATCTGAQRIDYDGEMLRVGESCLTAGDRTVTLAPCDGNDAQRWFQARGGFVTRANTSQCLRATTSALTLGDCTDAIEDRWALRGAIRDARAGLCLTAGAAGTPLALASCDDSASQRWTFWSR